MSEQLTYLFVHVLKTHVFMHTEPTHSRVVYAHPFQVDWWCMTKDVFQSLLKPDRYQVFVFSSPALFPFNFALHTWIVTAHHGFVVRFEVLYHQDVSQKSRGQLHCNALPPTVGLPVTFFSSTHWNSTLIALHEGIAGSPVATLVHFLEQEVMSTYPYVHQYVPLGPNSNTFTHWVLARHLDPSKTTLPWRAFGQHWETSESH